MRALDYDYVLVDAPPLLGIADSQALARNVDEILLVNRLDRITLERVEELGTCSTGSACVRSGSS